MKQSHKKPSTRPPTFNPTEKLLTEILQELVDEAANFNTVSKEIVAFNMGRLHSIQSLLQYAAHHQKKSLAVVVSVSIKEEVSR